MPDTLSPRGLEQALSKLNNWRLDDGALRRDLSFSDFVAAFSFLSAVALLAEKHGHHPEIANVYREVTLRLRTHDAGGRVSQRDVDLAEAIDAVAGDA